MMELLKLFLNPIALCREHFTFWGGGGGGSQTSTSYSTNLPQYAKPHYQELMTQAAKEIFTTDSSGKVTGIKSGEDMPLQTVVGLEPEQLAAWQELTGMKSPEEFDQARAGMTDALARGQEYGTRGLNMALAYDPTTRTFNQDYFNQYVNPYQQNVIDTALREARLKAAMDKTNQMRASIGRGTFGGARQALLQAEGDRNAMQTLSDIQYRGMSDAFKEAQQQFNTEEQRRQQALQYQASLGKDVGLAGLNMQAEMSKTLGALASARQDADLARIKAQEAVGTSKQAQKQKEADNDYQNAMAKYNFAKQQLQFYSDILRGNANALGSTTVQYNPATSTASQITSAGLAGLGLYKALS